MAHGTIALASELKELQTPVQRSGRAETVGRPTSRSVRAASRPSASVRIPCWRLWVWATSGDLVIILCPPRKPPFDTLSGKKLALRI